MSSDKVSPKQLQALLILNIFGTAVIALPRVASEFGGSDGWLIVVGAAAFAIGYGVLINSVSEAFCQESFMAYSEKILGKTFGKTVCLIFVVRLIITAGLELRIFGEIIRQTILYKTPQWATCSAITALAVYLVCKGYETRARLAEMLIYAVFIPLAVILAIASVKGDPSNLLPMLKTPPINLLAGSFYVSLTFRGMELGLLVGPLAKEPHKTKTAALRAATTVGAAMLATTVITMMKFGQYDLRAQQWPVIQLVDTLNAPGGFFERLDAVVISIWIMSFLISLSAGIFFSAFILSKPTATGSKYAAVCAFAILTVSLLPKNTVEVYKLLTVMDVFGGTAFMIFLPFLMFIIARLRRLGGESC